MVTVSARRVAALLHGMPRQPARAAGRPPAYRALATAVRTLVVDGRLPVGARLASERDLADELGLSRTTVTRAYDELRAAGFLHTRRGSGSVVRLPATSGAVAAGRPLIGVAEPAADVIDLAVAAQRAPEGMAEAYAEALAELPAHLAGVGYPPLGLPALREAIAQRYAARGLPTHPEQILVTSSAVSGVRMMVEHHASRSRPVALEDPSFPNTRAALSRSGFRLLPVPVDSSGWDLDAMGDLVRGVRPEVAVLIPDFHNPTGALLSDSDRERLAGLLRASGTVAVVDETVCELALDPAAERPRPFAAYARQAVLVGGASKSHWGGLRVGWVRTPTPVDEGLVAARVAADSGAAVLEQLVLTRLLATGRPDPIDRRTQLVSARDAVAAALRDRLPQARWTTPTGGLSLWVQLPGLSASEVALAAADSGLLVAAGPRFAVSHGHAEWLRLPYVVPPEVLVEAVDRLAAAVEMVCSGRGVGGAERGGPIVA
ncbi:MAG TPA: PLP-dependent aminotransferase family protein [Dermatophilaceae bacterium]|nr:PLP-dependent aminotransferase family protein [Dermatophilaceae bacterium]